MLENPEVQKKICHALRALCFYATIAMAIFFVWALWVEFTDSKLFIKTCITYVVIMVSSLIIMKIFTEDKKRDDA